TRIPTSSVPGRRVISPPTKDCAALECSAGAAQQRRANRRHSLDVLPSPPRSPLTPLDLDGNSGAGVAQRSTNQGIAKRGRKTAETRVQVGRKLVQDYRDRMLWD
ncbi:unnamed protein product, partial [Tuber aestivum]